MKVFHILFLSTLAISMVTTIANAQVAINEVDYQNPGSDDSEFVELVGRAGTVLDGWTLRGINANDGSVYADYVLQGTIDHDFDSAWGGQGGFFVIGTLDAETVARANAINTGINADVNPNQGIGEGKVAAKTVADCMPTNWLVEGNNLQNGGYNAGDPGDIIQLWDGVPESSNLIDEWYYDYESGFTETGLSQPLTTYDSAGTDTGTGATISSIGRYGYSFGTPILVFDNDAMTGLDLFDREPNDGNTWTFTGTEDFTSEVDLGSYGPFSVTSGSSFAENGSANEIYWSGTDAYTANKPQGPTPGTFNNASFGEGSQDAFTINILPESQVTIPGDTNDDNKVDQLDAQTVADNWGKPVSNGYTDGDFNNDGFVDATDAAIMAGNWGDYTSSESEGNVPEPGMLVLLAIGLVMLVNRRAAKL